jgi:nucleotide-binding universal stress UspA family protein
MVPETTPRSTAHVETTPLCKRVLVGVDRSTESIQAARRAARLTDPDGTLTLLGAFTVPPPTIGILGADLSHEGDAEIYRAVAVHAVAAASREIEPPAKARTKIVRGVAWTVLLDEVEREHVTLVVVGSRGRGRMRGIVMESTATELVHRAPCPVLIARSAGADFPRRIVVGVDGSPESAVAYTIGCELADRFGSELRPIVASGADREMAAAIVGSDCDVVDDDPVHALVAASAESDLIVVGSRGLHGVKALGSVSERVAHQATCSTLIFRPE